MASDIHSASLDIVCRFMRIQKERKSTEREFLRSVGGSLMRHWIRRATSEHNQSWEKFITRREIFFWGFLFPTFFLFHFSQSSEIFSSSRRYFSSWIFNERWLLPRMKLLFTTRTSFPLHISFATTLRIAFLCTFFTVTHRTAEEGKANLSSFWTFHT